MNGGDTTIANEFQLPGDERAIPPQHDSLTAAITSHLPRLYAVAFRTLRNVQEAEDALQDAMLSAVKNISQFKGEAQITTWLTAIVLNSARAYLRRRIAHKILSFEDMRDDHDARIENLVPDGKPTPEELYVRTERRERLARVARKLSPRVRSAFVLVVLRGLPAGDAARTLGISRGTLRTRLFHARRRVTQILRKSEWSPLGRGVGILTARPD